MDKVKLILKLKNVYILILCSYRNNCYKTLLKLE